MITSASYEAAPPQRDGRFYVTETIRVQGEDGPRVSSYLAEVDSDPADHLALMVAAIEDAPPPSPEEPV